MESQVKKKRKRGKGSTPGPPKQAPSSDQPQAAQPAAKKRSKPVKDDKKAPVEKSSAVDELDALFLSAIAAKRKQQDVPAPAAESAPKPQEVRGSKDDIFGNGGGAARKRTKEGYRIYSEEELRINRGGDTELCPFDCDCCF